MRRNPGALLIVAVIGFYIGFLALRQGVQELIAHQDGGLAHVGLGFACLIAMVAAGFFGFRAMLRGVRSYFS